MKRTRVLIGMCLLGGLLMVSAGIAQTDEPDINEFIFVDSDPVPQNLGEVRQQIAYPEEAVQQGIAGTVVARVLFDQQGKYVRHKIVKEIHPALAEAVEGKLSEIECEPAMQEGKPVMYWMNIPFPFKLVDEREANIRKSITSLTDSLTGNPEDYTLWHKRGIRRSDLGELEDALTDFEESLKLNPRKNKKKKKQSYEYLYYSQFAKGAVYAKQEEYEKAIAQFTLAIQTAAEMKAYDSAVQASVPSVYIERGYSHFAKENYEAAKADYQWVLDNDPDQECTIYPLLADIGLTLDESAELVGIYDGLIRCNPENILQYYSRGFYKMESGDHQGAIEDFGTVVEKSNNVDIKIASHNQAAYAYLQMKDYDSASAELQKALGINALNTLSYFYQGLVLQAQGLTEEACTAVGRSLSFGLEGDKKEEAVGFMEENCGGWEE